MKQVARTTLTAALAVACFLVIYAMPGGAAPAGFVTIQGSKLMIDGQTIRIKGSNYYPRDHMWGDMWNTWDWDEMVLECGMMRSLGLNGVRILVPYSHGGWGGANPPESRLQRLEDIVNLMGQNGIRSCVTRFDWETSYPDAGTSKEQEHLSYLSAIVARLKDNPYVFMWDVKNEPDHPSAINGFDDWDSAPVQKAKIVSWLQRMCNAVKARDPNHPVSVGLRWYNNVGDVLGFVDIACFHSYWSAITNSTEIPTIKAAMGAAQKPILAQEFGWPSNPNPCMRDGTLIWDFNESQQLAFYTQELQAFENHDIAGCLQWMTFDAKNYTTNQNESFENYFGLWRYNYSLKPAGAYYRDHFVTRPFPGAPPSPVESFAAQDLDTAVRLTWKNPLDARFVAAVVRARQDGFPSGPTDGTLVCDRPTAPGASDGYLHTGLRNGEVYYYAAFARDSEGAFSSAVQAVGRPHRPESGDYCGAARRLPEGSAVSLVRKIVTAVFPADGATYVREPDRSCGLRVEGLAAGVAVGDTVSVTGAMKSRVLSGIASERTVSQAVITRVDVPRESPVPLVLNCRSVGGGPVPPYLVGVKDGYGVNNIGQLVTITGRVTLIVGTVMFVDDGAGVQDTVGRTGVMVRCPSSAMPVAVGDTTSVTGIVEGSIPTGWLENRRLLQVRDWNDVLRVE